MLKIGSEVGQPDTRYLSRSIVALNLERSWARTTRVTLVWSHPLLSPSLPSIWRELTTRRLHGQSLEPQGWLEVCLKLRHWPDSVINSIYRCVRVYARVSRVTSKCDRPTPRARACVCVVDTPNDAGRDSIGGWKVIESQKSRGGGKKIP